LGFVGCLATRESVFRQPTTDPCQLSFRWKRSSCHRELIEPARA
jgi:hypothetical protein